jgi:hypothetical protein
MDDVHLAGKAREKQPFLQRAVAAAEAISVCLTIFCLGRNDSTLQP